MNNIDHLLNKYWEGESSLEEEQVLKDYFKSGNVANEHQAFSGLFDFFEVQSAITFQGELKMDEKIKTLPSPQFEKIFDLKRYVLAAAASVIILAGITFIVKNEVTKTEKPSLVHEIEDPEEALEVTLKALAMLSGSLNEGQATLINGLQNVEKAGILR
jgi:hypothetical protein